MIHRVCFAAISIFILVHVIPIPINARYQAKQIKLNDPSYMEDCQIRVSGYYHFNLFRNDLFNGQIEVSDNPLTAEKMSRVELCDTGTVLEYTFLADDDSNGEPLRMYYWLGLLFSKPLMLDMCILVYPGDAGEKYGAPKSSCLNGLWDERDGFCIISSVNSREEAIEVLRRYGLLSQ